MNNSNGIDAKKVESLKWRYGESSNELDVLIFTGDELPAFCSLESGVAEKYRNKEKRIKEAKLITSSVNNHDNLVRTLKTVKGVLENWNRDGKYTNLIEYTEKALQEIEK